MLWSISLDECVLVETMSYQDREPFRWARHPSNPNYLIHIANNEAHIYDWKTLSRLTDSAGILLEGSILPELSIRSITSCFNDTVLATTFSESLRPHSKSKLVLWNTADFAPESSSAAPIPNYHHLADHVEVLIGTTAWQTDRLIFLHSSNWVCAADSPTANSDQYVRQFFFPADWLSSNLELIIKVSARGDLILVKRDEVAVVKRGLLMARGVEMESEKQGARRPLFAPNTRKSSTLTIPPPPQDGN